MRVHISHSIAVKTTLAVQRQTAQISEIKQWLKFQRKQDRDFAMLLFQRLLSKGGLEWLGNIRIDLEMIYKNMGQDILL